MTTEASNSWYWVELWHKGSKPPERWFIKCPDRMTLDDRFGKIRVRWRNTDSTVPLAKAEGRLRIRRLSPTWELILRRELKIINPNLLRRNIIEDNFEHGSRQVNLTEIVSQRVTEYIQNEMA